MIHAKITADVNLQFLCVKFCDVETGKLAFLSFQTVSKATGQEYNANCWRFTLAVKRMRQIPKIFRGYRWSSCVGVSIDEVRDWARNHD